MKHLLNFHLFLEKVDVKDTDPAHVKLAKDKLNSTENHLIQYPNLKAKIDSIYKANKDKPESETYKQVLDSLGKDPKSRNPYAVTYAEVAKLEIEIKKLTDSILVDDTGMKLSSQNLSLATSEETKKKMQADLIQMKKNLDSKKKKLDDSLKQVDKSKQMVNQEIIKTQKEIADASKKLAEKEKK